MSSVFKQQAVKLVTVTQEELLQQQSKEKALKTG